MRCLKSQKYIDEVYGKVNLRVLSTARRVTASWRGDVLHVTIPAMMPLELYQETMRRMQPDILKMRRRCGAFYHDGYVWTGELVALSVRVGPRMAPYTVERFYDGRDADGRYVFSFLTGSDSFSAPDCDAILARMIARTAGEVARRTLIAELQALAQKLGVERRISGCAIGRGERRLGTCSTAGVITLSRRLVYMPREMRRAVMTHEMAHLDHFDHSPAFYRRWEELYGGPVRHFRRAYASVPMPYPV